MKRNVSLFSQKEYDCLIIGGGINGAAMANMATLNGLKTALLEKNDFASGASSKSTKLIHGGLRYLENFEFDLVTEALHERHIQLHSAPHLVKPLAFIIPVYKTDRRPLWMMKFGVFLYDLLSGKYVVHKHRALTAADVTRLVPAIKPNDLVGGVLYYDAQMDDARLCLENVLSAAQRGADVANYVEVRSIIHNHGKAVGVVAIDKLSGNIFEIKAKKIICTLGPWTNDFLKQGLGHPRHKVRTTKGIHIVYRGKFCDDALLIPTQSEKRIFFIIPWMGNSLIGTTDTDFNSNPDNVDISEEDVGYLLKEAARIFPEGTLKRENIITTFAGLRPLVHREGHPSEISRQHVIEKTDSGVIFVMGGKYTTYRKIAEDTMRLLINKKPIDTRKNFPLYGNGPITQTPGQISQQYGVTVETAQHLCQLYGSRYTDVLMLVNKNNNWKERICSCSPAIRAQIVYAIETEMACKEEDVIIRRLSLGYLDCSTLKCREEIRKMIINDKTN